MPPHPALTAKARLNAEDYAFSRLISYAAYQWPGYADAAHHRLIARALEAVERGEIRRLMITMPPRHGKSMLASEYFPAWYLGRNPGHYVIAATYAQELADDFGRKVRNQIGDPAFNAVFPGVALRTDSQSAKRFGVTRPGEAFVTEQDGAYFAVGVGGPLTGRGAHLLLIDDPVKNREEAESETIRQKTKNWYTSTAYTRLMPGGRIVVIQCMTGDTPVLMADGTERALRDIRIGDAVATYEKGKLGVSWVLNWANHGPNCVYEIKTTCGKAVRANERHPFLVDRNGALSWVRVRDLKTGDAIVQVDGLPAKALDAADAITKTASGSLTPRADARRMTRTGPEKTPSAITANGRASPALSMVAIGQLAVRECAPLTTARLGGRVDTAHPVNYSHDCITPVSLNTVTGSLSQSMTPCSPDKATLAPSVGEASARVHLPTGRSFASITATIQGASEGCFATTAISSSAEGATSKRSSRLFDTFNVTKGMVASIRRCGCEDVFDIQVARTENFVAGGLVSHNTRWHEDDLSGWLVAEHAHEGWVRLDLPAIDTEGHALWPEQYPLEALQAIRRAIGPRDWSALYQQRPSPEEGDFFKAEWLRLYDGLPPPRNEMQLYGGSDYAVTADGGDYTVHVVVGLDPEGRMYLVDLWRKQAASDVWVDAFCDLVREWKPLGWAEEAGQIRGSVGPFLTRRQQERSAYVARETFPTHGDKAIRAQSIRGRMALNGLYIARNAPWLADLRSELLSFPAGKFDDTVDALGLVGQLLDKMVTGRRFVPPAVRRFPLPGQVPLPGPPEPMRARRIRV